MGTHAVIAQYRNKAGQLSGLYSDTIERVAPYASVSVLDLSLGEGTGVFPGTKTFAVSVQLSQPVPNADVAVTPWPSDHRAVVATIQIP